MYRLESGAYGVTIDRDGADWRATIRDKSTGLIAHRYFTAQGSAPDGGLLRVTRALRHEFGIVGAYRADGCQADG
jgi:hypothetical protein